MLEILSDNEIMQQVRLNSRDAFRVLVTRWQRSLYRFFGLLGIDGCDVEDCVQETFLRVFAYRERYRSEGSNFRAFLFRIGRNVSVDLYRKNERTPTAVSPETELATPMEDPAPLWDDCFDCEWALALLPDRLRVVVILNVYEGLSYRETAEALCVPLGTIKSRMHHALQQIRGILRVDARI